MDQTDYFAGYEDKKPLKMKTYEITIQTVILEEDNIEDAENIFLSMMEEGCLEYEIKELPSSP